MKRSIIAMLRLSVCIGSLVLVASSSNSHHSTKDLNLIARKLAMLGIQIACKGLADFVLRLERLGYRGAYSFEVFNDDYQQLPPDTVARRARRSALWLNDDVLHRPAPLPQWTHGR